MSDQNSDLSSYTADVNSNEYFLLPCTMTKESQTYTDSSKIDKIVDVDLEKDYNPLEPQVYSKPKTDKIGDVGSEKAGDILVLKEKNQSYVKSSSTSQSWNKRKKKKTTCKYCLFEVTNFERHLERNHIDCKEVRDMLSYPKKHLERKKL
ncbi:uncharacterized protein [Leptinotarsa decemlineata]|uniref:uncharacterized protein n=1 Tax=Leptinotarsa decemlineata TaxID=7539 RepID=UPI003D30408C